MRPGRRWAGGSTVDRAASRSIRTGVDDLELFPGRHGYRPVNDQAKTPGGCGSPAYGCKGASLEPAINYVMAERSVGREPDEGVLRSFAGLPPKPTPKVVQESMRLAREYDRRHGSSLPLHMNRTTGAVVRESGRCWSRSVNRRETSVRRSRRRTAIATAGAGVPGRSGEQDDSDPPVIGAGANARLRRVRSRLRRALAATAIPRRRLQATRLSPAPRHRAATRQ